MALREQHELRPASIQLSVEIEADFYRKFEHSFVENPPTLDQVAGLLLAGFVASLVESLPEDESKRAEIETLLNNAKVQLSIVERSSELNGIEVHRPTLDELMEMSPEARGAYLARAAALMEDEYRNNPELTISADATELYDYPDT